MIGKISKVIRVMTVAPLMAFTLLTTLWFLNNEWFGGLHNYILSVIFLCVMPLLAYPLQPIVPGFKGKGREGQRNFAIVMAVAGYVCGIIAAFITHAPREMWIIYLTYLISGLGIVLFNVFLKIRASGHTCGIVGPLVIMYVCAGAKALWGLIILALACISSLIMKRHTVSQLVWGGVIPIVSLLISIGCTQLAF